MAEKNENTERNEKEEKFQAKLKELLALAKKKKNVLEYQEISDFFQDMELNAEQFEKILDFLETSNIVCCVSQTTMTIRLTMRSC